jgi:hypothetical protein
LAGFPLYIELLHLLNITKVFEKHIDGTTHKYCLCKNSMTVISLLLLNLAGDEHVDDLRILQSDNGFYRIYKAIFEYNLNNIECSKLEYILNAQRYGMVHSP